MDAEDLRAFDELASEAGAGLWPCEVVIGGQSYEATCPEPRVRTVETDDGAEAVASVTVWIRKAEMASRPAVEGVMTAFGRQWYVREVTGDRGGDAEWCLRAEARN